MNSALNNMTSIDRKINSKNQSTNPIGEKAQERNAIVSSDSWGGGGGMGGGGRRLGTEQLKRRNSLHADSCTETVK